MGQRNCHPPCEGRHLEPRGMGPLAQGNSAIRPGSKLRSKLASTSLSAGSPSSFSKEETVAGTMTSVMLEGWEL